MLTVVSKSLLCYFRFCTTVSIFYGARLVCKNQQTRPLASLFLDKRNRLEKEIQEGELCSAMQWRYWIYRWFFISFSFISF